MTSASRNRLLAVGALAIAGIALAAIAFGGIGKNLVYYWTPGEMLAHGGKAYGPTIRLGGVVQKGSMQWNAGHTELTFRLADGLTAEAQSVKVVSTEVPPQMFREGIGCVVEGTFDPSQVFTSNRLMVKHSNEYRAPKAGEQHEDWKKSIEGPSASSTPVAGQASRSE